MNQPHFRPLEDLRQALGDHLELTDKSVDRFLDMYDAGEIETPPMPSHLLPAPLARSIAGESACTSGASHTDSLSELSLAARNGDGPLSEETLEKLRKEQES